VRPPPALRCNPARQYRPTVRVFSEVNWDIPAIGNVRFILPGCGYFADYRCINVEPDFPARRSSHASDVGAGDKSKSPKGIQQARGQNAIRCGSEPGEHAMRRDFLSTREGLACNREIRKRLGQALRTTYEPDISQGLPRHLADLLGRLEDRERDRTSSRLPAHSSRSA